MAGTDDLPGWTHPLFWVFNGLLLLVLAAHLVRSVATKRDRWMLVDAAGIGLMVWALILGGGVVLPATHDLAAGGLR
jgi:hypothetical protein